MYNKHLKTMQHLINKPLFGTKINWSNPLTNKLRGCWLFGGSGWRTYDLTELNNHGVQTSFPSPINQNNIGYQFTSALSNSIVMGTSYHHNGSNGDGSDKISIEVIIYFDDFTVNHDIFSRVYEACAATYRRYSHYEVYIDTSGKLIFEIHQTNAACTANLLDAYKVTNVLLTKKWYHIVITSYNNDNQTTRVVKFYVNGTLWASTQTTDTDTSSAMSKASNLYITKNVRTNLLNGIVNYIRFWKGRILSDNETKQLYINPYDMFN